jgi:hypothetical protein
MNKPVLDDVSEMVAEWEDDDNRDTAQLRKSMMSRTKDC